jgi:hypothetical protein
MAQLQLTLVMDSGARIDPGKARIRPARSRPPRGPWVRELMFGQTTMLGEGRPTREVHTDRGSDGFGRGTRIVESYRLGVNGYKPVDFKYFADVIVKLGTYWLVVNTPPL